MLYFEIEAASIQFLDVIQRKLDEYEALSVKEMRQVLKDVGTSSSGNKLELVHKLVQHFMPVVPKPPEATCGVEATTTHLEGEDITKLFLKGRSDKAIASTRAALAKMPTHQNARLWVAGFVKSAIANAADDEKTTWGFLLGKDTPINKTKTATLANIVYLPHVDERQSLLEVNLSAMQDVLARFDAFVCLHASGMVVIHHHVCMITIITRSSNNKSNRLLGWCCRQIWNGNALKVNTCANHSANRKAPAPKNTLRIVLPQTVKHNLL